MEIFTKSCTVFDLDKDTFFLEWHRAIKRDLDVFKIVLQNYKDNSGKNFLIKVIEFIKKNIDNTETESDYMEIFLSSTPNYFIYSFFPLNGEIPSYVLVSKDYKRFLYSGEQMECFDDPDFNEELRYGVYNYFYFNLSNNKVYFYAKDLKEYTWDYIGRFESYKYSKNIKDNELYYNDLLNNKNYDLVRERKI